jgi:hypothetical protein
MFVSSNDFVVTLKKKLVFSGKRVFFSDRRQETCAFMFLVLGRKEEEIGKKRCFWVKTFRTRKKSFRTREKSLCPVIQSL